MVIGGGKKTGAQISEPEKVFDKIARCVRVKLIHWGDWNTILEGKEHLQEWNEQESLEAETTPCPFKFEEKTWTDFHYVLKIGKKRFLCIYKAEMNVIEVYKEASGSRITDLEPLFTFSMAFLEGMEI